MKAITLLHPWPWAICCCGKRLENRTWEPPLRVGEKFAIHGGRVPLGPDNQPHGAKDREYLEEIIETVNDIRKECLFQGDTVSLRNIFRYAGICAVATFGGVLRDAADPWFSGPVAWVLRDVIVLPEAVPCKGTQKLWEVPPDVLENMRAQFRVGD